MILRDPIHGLVSFEAEAYEIVPQLLETREMQRLRRIRQLGLTSFAYPGADHTRFSHAIGAAHVMVRFVQRLQEAQGDLPFWQRLTTERSRDAVAAALLHDVGHGPFSHLFEDAIVGSPKHETWTERVILDPDTEVHHVLIAADPGLPKRIVELIRGESPLTYLAHTVSGTFDVDRCDYLLRDAHFTGVSYGQYDLDWLLRSLCLSHAGSGDCPQLAIDGAKGIPAIESFTLARLFMFQQVYFHKASRSSEWMLGRILGRVRQLLVDGTRLPAVPKAVHDLAVEGHAQLIDYLELDDVMLWRSIAEWKSCDDPILSDLSQRLYHRRLFKTQELFGAQATPEAYQQLQDRALALAEERGLLPEVYVGLDQTMLIPFDDTKESLMVQFPDGRSQSPAEVSFLLGRLKGERLERTRLIFPKELRDDLRKAVAEFKP